MDNQAKWGTTSFKAYCGWMSIFIKQNIIKVRKRKCGKEKTDKDCIGDYEEFINRLRFYFLHTNEYDGYAGRDPLCGRFPLEQRYTMEQVTLPFINSRDYTFTVKYYNNLKIKCPKESLCKRQFTMHLVFNASTSDKYWGWCAFICKEIGKMIQAAEKESWYKDVGVFWQNKK